MPPYPNAFSFASDSSELLVSSTVKVKPGANNFKNHKNFRGKRQEKQRLAVHWTLENRDKAD